MTEKSAASDLARTVKGMADDTVEDSLARAAQVPGLIRTLERAAREIGRLLALRAIDQETIERLTKEAISDAQAIRLAKAQNKRDLTRLEMIGAMCGPDVQRSPVYTAEDIAALLDLKDLPPQPCGNCQGPLMHGDGQRCEWCGAPIPPPEPKEQDGRAKS